MRGKLGSAGRSHDVFRQVELLLSSASKPVLPEVLAVFGMTEQPQDVNSLPVIVDGGNQPVLVAADIEDGHGVPARHSHRVSVRINAPKVLKVFPLGLSKEAMPLLQGFGCIGISLSKFAKTFARDDAHVEINSFPLLLRGGGCM